MHVHEPPTAASVMHIRLCLGCSGTNAAGMPCVSIMTAILGAFQIGFTDNIDPALSLKLISQSALAFFNRHLPLTSQQRSMLQCTASSSTAVSADHIADFSQQTRIDANLIAESAESGVSRQQNGGGSMQPGDVVPGQLTAGTSQDAKLSNRTFNPRVLPEERGVFEDICKGHIAILDLSL